jgi:tetratricopeptide (TPR) repeat protein
MKRGVLLALALGAVACASPGAPPEQSAPALAVPGAEARAEADAQSAREPEQSPELAFLLAQELEQAGKLDEAYARYEHILASDPDDAFLLTHLAQLAFRLDKASDARVYAERAHAQHADDPWLRAFLANAYHEDGDLARVVDVLTNAEGDPVDADAAAQLYRVWMEKGITEQARRVARWQVDAEPELPASWLNLAEVTAKQGDVAGAEKILREADRKYPEEVQFLAAIAALRRARGDRLGELGVLSELLARSPEDAAAWLGKAEAEFDLGRDEDGRRSLAEAEKHQPDDVRTTIRIALLDMQRGAFADAEQRLARIAEQYPEQYEVAYFLGVARRRAGDIEGALLAFDRIAEGHARFADGRAQVASILEAEGDFAGARAEVERAQTAHNSLQLAYYHASLVAKEGDVAAGVAELEAMLKGGPEDAETHYNLGILRSEAGDQPAALAAMEQTLALDAEHAGALNFVGYSLAERGERLDEAQALIERALAQRPDDGYVTDSLGWVFFQRSRAAAATGDAAGSARWLEAARAKLEEAHTLTGGDPVVSEHLGDVYLALGKKRVALEKYEQAVAQTPRAGEQPALADKLARLRRELGVQ